MVSNTVLIITAETQDANILRDSLATAKDGPFAVEWVQCLSDGLVRLKQGGIDIVLVDFFLPDSQGIATFDALFKFSPPVPILMLTDDDGENLAIDAVQGGAQGFLSKGHFPNTLIPQALRNIIQRKLVEDALFVVTERARVTLESIGDGVVSTDVAGNVTYLNSKAEQMTGWSRENASGQPVTKVFHLIDSTTRQPARNPVMQAIEQQKTIGLVANSVLVRRDGYESPIEDSVAPIFDKIGKVHRGV